MKLATLFSEENILIHMDAVSLEDAIQKLVQSFGRHLGRLNPAAVSERLIEVENSLPVPPEYGVRIPHARLGGIEQLFMAVGTSQEGIPVSEDSDERVHLIFVILTPKLQSSLMLQTMASIARLVLNEEHRKALMSTTSPQRVLRILEETGIEVKRAVIAGDLMNPLEYPARPDMTLRQVVAAMVQSREEGIPVISEEGELLGDISTRMVIEVGLPKYMNLVSNPRVLSEFEPFEAFYRKEDSILAGEIMKPDVLRLAPDTPVEIMAHEMVAKKSERAYVVEDKKLLGVVYRKDIVRKVLAV